MIELTPADLPDALASMDNGADVTREMICALLDLDSDKIKDGDYRHLLKKWSGRITAMRAVASRTRPATPAPDAMAEAVELMRTLADLSGRDLKLYRDETGGGDFDMNTEDAIKAARAFIARNTGEK